MLRMEFNETPSGIIVRMEGRFVKEFAEHARMLIGRSTDPSGFTVDLSNVTFVDAIGEEVLIWLKDIGVSFIAETAYCRDICDRLKLPLSTPRPRVRRAIRKIERPSALGERAPVGRDPVLSTFSFGEEN